MLLLILLRLFVCLVMSVKCYVNDKIQVNFCVNMPELRSVRNDICKYIITRTVKLGLSVDSLLLNIESYILQRYSMIWFTDLHYKLV